MFYRCELESEIYPSLSRIPLHVRMKLDITGSRISLKTWLSFSLEERWALCHLPVESEEEMKVFFSYLDFLSRRYGGEGIPEPSPMTSQLWADGSCIPEAVLQRSHETEKGITPDEWSQWNHVQRYVLYKLSISKNEPEKFHQALQEFRGRPNRS